MATEGTIELPSADENGDGTKVIESQPTKSKIIEGAIGVLL